MSVHILIQCHDPRWKTRLKPYTSFVRAQCEAALVSAKIKKGELTIVLADDAFIRDLNKTYRRKDKPTNVLSFNGEGDHIGDLVLAYETIAREADEQDKSFRHHTAHLLVHGVLHLLGHDHERDNDAQKMEAAEIKILKKLGISNPYL